MTKITRTAQIEIAIEVECLLSPAIENEPPSLRELLTISDEMLDCVSIPMREIAHITHSHTATDREDRANLGAALRSLADTIENGSTPKTQQPRRRNQAYRCVMRGM